MKVAINGFGRIGRLVARISSDYKDIDIVAINSSKNTAMLANLLKHDSIYRDFDKKVSYDSDSLYINDKKILVFEERTDISKLPWKDLDIEIVVESTGKFTKKEDAYKHIIAGCKKVLISAPSKDADCMVVYGVNHKDILPSFEVISAASCTTNCLAPVCKVLNDEFGIEKGTMTTVHAYTSDQRLLDGTHKKDPRRARAAAINMVPTSTGAARAIGKIFPELEGKLDGISLRVPVPTASIVDLSVNLKKNPEIADINEAFKGYSNDSMKGILYYSQEPLVSSDIIGSRYSSIVDGLLISKIQDIYKVFSWYDNEFGYASRIVDLIRFLSGGGD
ncbi:MAG: type I glyceraldehyde-3-phosphate dehydrogenase [Fervidicoccus fontis]|uniref:Glyceraldehyde-3-phosphate dehydrogenase n=1 Tax=Thermodesulfobium acidiphilum TaxID=1794699 RepID=A0A2R4VZ04_THEAF|nr:type I glyceraldehyde-3-phosphate dehydrogenase [Thermodesulfobium acidiphilum]AWB09781.1 glyceraldehyde 3-phosphate dehydrogenase [Thermodesulfobium acidiphilum]PMB77457.1 MAG: type I glyceraldehyde-3-phosphate dehydrogenase [Fervidicoccus fontis]